MKGEVNQEQVKGLQKYTDITNLVEETASPVEQTTAIGKSNDEHKMALAKGTVETGDLVSSTKENKPSVHVKVLSSCMQYIYHAIYLLKEK